MKAIILNSGIGKRIGEITRGNPKCLIEIRNGETIIKYQIQNLIDNKIDKIIITTGSFERKLKNYVKENFPQLYIKYVNNPKYSSTNYIYTIFLVKDFINDDVVLIHGDVVFEESVLKKIIDSQYRDCVLINNKITPQKDFKAKVENGIVKEIGVNVYGENCFFLVPLYKFSKRSFNLWLDEIGKFIKLGKVNSYAEDALNNLLKDIEIRPVYSEGEFCMEIDDIGDLEIAKKFFKNKRE